MLACPYDKQIKKVLYNVKVITEAIFQENCVCVKFGDIKENELLMVYDYATKCYYVVNLLIHRYTHRLNDNQPVEINFKNTRAEAKNKKEVSITYFYRQLNPFRCSFKRYRGYEKHVIVSEESFFDFLSNYTYYLIPNQNDKLPTEHPIFYVIDDELVEIKLAKPETFVPIVRELYKCERAKRDTRFRDKVLKKWNYTCAVCGCKDENILEAAHIKGVSDGGDDSVENGICLCANHHIMYDYGSIDINFECGTYKFLDDTFACLPKFKNNNGIYFLYVS